LKVDVGGVGMGKVDVAKRKLLKKKSALVSEIWLGK